MSERQIISDAEYEQLQDFFSQRDAKRLAQIDSVTRLTSEVKPEPELEPELELEQKKQAYKHRGRNVLKCVLGSEVSRIATSLIVISGILFSIAMPLDELSLEVEAKPASPPVIEESYSQTTSDDFIIDQEPELKELEFSEKNIDAKTACANVEKLLKNEDFKLEGDDCKQKLTYLYQKIGFSKAQAAGLLANNLIENPSLNPFQRQIDSDAGIGIFMETSINRYGKKGERYPGYQYPAQYDGLVTYVDNHYPELSKYFKDPHYSFKTHSDNTIENGAEMFADDPILEEAVDKALTIEVAYCFSVKYSGSSYERKNIESVLNNPDSRSFNIAQKFCSEVERPSSKDTANDRAELAEKIYATL